MNVLVFLAFFIVIGNVVFKLKIVSLTTSIVMILMSPFFAPDNEYSLQENTTGSVPNVCTCTTFEDLYAFDVLGHKIVIFYYNGSTWVGEKYKNSDSEHLEHAFFNLNGEKWIATKTFPTCKNYEI